jgi:hypothetical protein
MMLLRCAKIDQARFQQRMVRRKAAVRPRCRSSKGEKDTLLLFVGSEQDKSNESRSDAGQ